MADIGVCMRADILEHKQEDGRKSEGRYCYWRMEYVPEGVGRGTRLWVMSRKRWRGYFVLNGVDYCREEGNSIAELVFDSESWVERDGGPRSPFQGYTFKVPESPAPAPRTAHRRLA